MKIRGIIFALGAFGAFILLIAADQMARIPWKSETGIDPQAAALPTDFGAVPDFSLTDSSGRNVRRRDLLGHPWLAAFIFTRCQGQCPLMTARMKELAKQLPGLPMVSFSVDPYDTPKVLAQYRREQGANWLFLCGHNDEVSRLSVKGFHLGVANGGSREEPLTHSNKLVLVDKTGEIRGYFDGTDSAASGSLIAQARGMTEKSSAP